MENRTVLFNPETSVITSLNRDYNLMSLRQANNYINDLLQARGYIYMDRIYDILGLAWNPKETNECFKYEEVKCIELVAHIDSGDEFGFMVTIKPIH